MKYTILTPFVICILATNLIGYFTKDKNLILFSIVMAIIYLAERLKN
jgi:hypothetical protein